MIGWTLSSSFSFANLFSGTKTEIGNIEGEREVQQACCCCVCEKICTTVVTAQFGVGKKQRWGKNSGIERSAASMLLLCVRENMYDSSRSTAVWGLRCVCIEAGERREQTKFV